MLNVADDHKNNGPFTARSLVTPSKAGGPSSDARGGINKRDNVTAALRCHGGRRAFSQAEHGDDKGGELES